MEMLDVALSAEMKAFVESQVATGQFVDASDYIRDAIRDRQERVERLRALIDEGDASGTSPRTFDEIFAAIKERHGLDCD